MRLLRAITIGMGLLIVVATTVLVVVIARRLEALHQSRRNPIWCWKSRKGRVLSALRPVGTD